MEQQQSARVEQEMRPEGEPGARSLDGVEGVLGSRGRVDSWSHWSSGASEEGPACEMQEGQVSMEA